MATYRPYFPWKIIERIQPQKPDDPVKYIRKKAKTPEGYILEWKNHLGKMQSKVFRVPETQAKRILNNIISEIDQINAGVKPAPEKSLKLPIAIDLYLKHLRNTKHAPATVTRYARSLKPFQSFLQRGIKVKDIIRRDIERFKILRLESCSENGVNTDLRHIKAFFNWCYGMDIIHRSPFTGIRIESKNKPVRFLTADELHALFDVIQDDINKKDLITFFLNSGARANELLPPRLKWSNVKQNEIVLIGKGNRIRHVVLNDTMVGILESRKHLPNPFPYAYDTIYDWIVRQTYKKAGIIEANIHTLRKTAGALLIQAGVDIYKVSKFLGHSSVTVTEKHYVDLLKRDYVDISNIIENQVDFYTEMIRKKGTKVYQKSVRVNPYHEFLTEEKDKSSENANPHKMVSYRDLAAVPGAGLEPARAHHSRDFKSLVSTNSTTRAKSISN